MVFLEVTSTRSSGAVEASGFRLSRLVVEAGEEEFELNWVESLAFFAEHLPNKKVELLAQKAVFFAQGFDFFGELFLQLGHEFSSSRYGMTCQFEV